MKGKGNEIRNWNYVEQEMLMMKQTNIVPLIVHAMAMNKFL